MSHMWKSTITMDKELATRLIEKHAKLQVLSIQFLAEGFDNVAYLVNKKLVFRFPRREMGALCLENEIIVLPYISSKVSFSLSCPQYIGSPGEEYPFHFAGYTMLSGMPLSDTKSVLVSKKSFAKTLALWLKELHAVPVLKEHYALIKKICPAKLEIPQRIEICKNSILRYESHFLDAGFSKHDLSMALDMCSSYNFDTLKKHCYIHGDLYSRHIIVDDSINPAGLIDWRDVAIGHPEIDLSVGIMIFSDECAKTFFDFYGDIDKNMEYAAIYRAFCHSIILLPYCYENKEETLKNWTILALTRAMKKIGVC